MSAQPLDGDALTDDFVAALASPEPLIAAWARYRLRVLIAFLSGAADPFDQYFAGADVSRAPVT
jgi:hypothetical protein